MTRAASQRDKQQANKQSSTLQLLLRCARMANEQSLARVAASSKRAPRAAQSALFPHIDLEGSRITDIAERAGITKQAVGQLVDELEQAKLVERRADSSDRRAKLVVWTTEGKKQLAQSTAVMKDVEAELAKAVGKKQWAAMREALTALSAHFDAKV